MMLVDKDILDLAFVNPALFFSANVPVCREKRGCEALAGDGTCLLSGFGPLEAIACR